jgi:DNA-binding transcriptional LysR family regulator
VGRAVDIAYSVESVTTTKEVILEGMAAGIMPFPVVEHEVRAGLLEAHEIVEPELSLTSYFLVAPDARLAEHEPALFDFLDQLLDLAVQANMHSVRLRRISEWAIEEDAAHSARDAIRAVES